LVAFLSVADASGATLTYQSQTGELRASGSHPLLPSSAVSYPISGLSDVDETLLASEATPPDAYEGRAELTTSLGATQLFLEGFTAGSVEGCDPFMEPGCLASASANLTIIFDLSAPALVQIQHGVAPWAANNGPMTVLTHSSLGFTLTVDYFGSWECGSVDIEQCLALVDVFGPGAILPAGEYELEFDLFAFTPVGSCNVGCGSAGGFYQLNVIPEPVPSLSAAGLALLGGLLFAVGLAGLAIKRGGRAL
jgi:hypothetical protein